MRRWGDCWFILLCFVSSFRPHTLVHQKRRLAMPPDSQEPANSRRECWDCEQDPIGSLKQMFVDIVQSSRIKFGQDPAQRPVFLKLHGVAHGRLEVQPDLPENLKIGVFAMSSFPAWVRFSSDTLPVKPDLKTTLGIGI